MTRVLICEALVGEHKRLTERVNQMLERVEASLKQCMRLAQMEAHEHTQNATQTHTPGNAATAPRRLASLLMSYIIGRWHRYVRSGFTRPPAEHADAQLLLILQ